MVNAPVVTTFAIAEPEIDVSLPRRDSNAGPGVKTMGQAVNNAVTYGLGLMAGFLVSGWLVDAVGIRGLFWISSGAAAAAGVVFHWHRRSARC